MQRGKSWEPLREGQSYVVAVPKFIFQCGDGYDFKKYVTEYVPGGPDIRALTYQALTGLAAAKKPILPLTDDRIIDVPRYALSSPVRQAVWVPINDADKVCR